MAGPSSKVASRIADGLKKFQGILSTAKSKDVNESNTVVIVTDILSEIFGYDKYSEITTEHAIKSTWCDLAISIDGAIKILVEVKAIGLELKENHIKQAVDYAANQGVDWVILTNGAIWKVFKVSFTKPINQELVVDVDMMSLAPKTGSDIETLYLLSKEGTEKYALDDIYTQRQATNKFLIGNLLLTDDILNAIRKELRQIYPDIKVQIEGIRDTLEKDVLKREVVEGDEAERAKKKISRADRKQQRAKQNSASEKAPSSESSAQ